MKLLGTELSGCSIPFISAKVIHRLPSHTTKACKVVVVLDKDVEPMKKWLQERGWDPTVRAGTEAEIEAWASLCGEDVEGVDW